MRCGKQLKLYRSLLSLFVRTIQDLYFLVFKELLRLFRKIETYAWALNAYAEHTYNLIRDLSFCCACALGAYAYAEHNHNILTTA
jgi:hypothetical protein